MGENKWVLAMYDIRGKQEFIFRTNKLQEIVGASWLIRDCFEDYLFPAAEKVAKEQEIFGEKGKGIFSYKRVGKDDADKLRKFTENSFKQHLDDGYIGEVVYDGGGNFILLFQSRSIFQKVTYVFTKSLLESIGTLRVLGSCVEIEHLKDYKGDRQKLQYEHRKNEAQESNIFPWACPPFSQVDRKTSMPLIDSSEIPMPNGGNLNTSIIKRISSYGKMTKEAYVKRLKYHVEMEKIAEAFQRGELKADDNKKGLLEFYNKNEKYLDELVEEKGVDSQIAVIYIDGNSMGAKVQKITEGKKTYEDCVEALRNFSEDIQKLYVEDGIEHALKDINGKYRIVVSAGDEINFIVKASDAFRCARNYLDALWRHNQEKEDDASACAGIAVFHSHAPYAEAYRIAEECCETGKKRMKETGLACASFIDFHICQGAIGTSLEDIREEENRVGEDLIISRPWLLWKKDGEDLSEFTEFGESPQLSYEKITISDVCQILRQFGRSNIKGLAAAAQSSKVDLEMELRRIWAHAEKKVKDKITEKNWNIFMNMDELKKRQMIYDIVIAYDLWFEKEKK